MTFRPVVYIIKRWRRSWTLYWVHQ